MCGGGLRLGRPSDWIGNEEGFRRVILRMIVILFVPRHSEEHWRGALPSERSTAVVGESMTFPVLQIGLRRRMIAIVC